MTNAYVPLPFKLKGSNTGFHTEIVGRLSMTDMYNSAILKRHQEIKVNGFIFPFDAKYLGKHGVQELVYPIETARLMKLHNDFLTKFREEYEYLSHTELKEYYDLFN
ncbi:MAG: hypothetical protein V7L22_24140 [Nostoc sp.]|uniref:hypothetical protein n=1 Tax=Nostoc sp. TaxID=1180 RepID=UPI002FFCD2EF